MPLLRDLNLRTKETVHLAILQETRAISIEKFDSPQPVGLDARLGGVMPLHCTGVGKTIAGLPRRGPAESDCPAAGAHAHDRAHHYGVAAIAEGVGANSRAGLHAGPGRSGGGITLRGGAGVQPPGQMVAAFSVAGPATRLTPARIPEIAQLVRETSQQISYRLGYRHDRRPLAGPPASSPARGASVSRRGRAGNGG